MEPLLVVIVLNLQNFLNMNKRKGREFFATVIMENNLIKSVK